MRAVKLTAVSGAPAAMSIASTANILRASSTASPRMGIITIRNENLAICSRLSPMMMPVAIVDPERDRPGRTATAWAQPITKASTKVMSRGLPPIRGRSPVCPGRVRVKYEKASRAAVPRRQYPTRPMPSPNIISMVSLKNTPTIPMGMQDTRILQTYQKPSSRRKVKKLRHNGQNSFQRTTMVLRTVAT